MKATDLLRKQHGEVRTLMSQLSDAEASERGELVTKLSRTLRGHAAIEEELFYPKLEDDPDLEDLVSDSFREHDEMKTALTDLERCAPEDEEFGALLENLQDIVEHHVGEEESEMFPRVERLFTRDALDGLGKAMRRRFDDLRAHADLASRPDLT